MEFVPDSVMTMIRSMASFKQSERDYALANLQDFFQQQVELKEKPKSKPVLNHQAMVIVWKGLHAAMLQQDQPVLQEKLADQISGLIHCFKKYRDANIFITAAMETFGREWEKVNVFMTNKMMMFFRRVIRQAIFRLASNGWSYSKVFMDMLEEKVIRPLDHNNAFPLAVKLYLCDVFLEELAKGSNRRLTHHVLMNFFRPYIKVLALSRQNVYLHDVRTNVFQHLLRQSDLGVDQHADLQENERLFAVEDMEEEEDRSESGSGDEDNESEDEDNDQNVVLDPRAGNVDVMLPQLQVDYAQLNEALYEVLTTPGLRKINRAALRQLVREYQDLVGGVYTLEERISMPKNPKQAIKEHKDMLRKQVRTAVADRLEELRLNSEEYMTIKGKKSKFHHGIERFQMDSVIAAKRRTAAVLNDHRKLRFNVEGVKHRRRHERYLHRKFLYTVKNTEQMMEQMERRRRIARGEDVSEEGKQRNAENTRKIEYQAVIDRIARVAGGFKVTDKKGSERTRDDHGTKSSKNITNSGSSIASNVSKPLPVSGQQNGNEHFSLTSTVTATAVPSVLKKSTKEKAPVKLKQNAAGKKRNFSQEAENVSKKASKKLKVTRSVTPSVESPSTKISLSKNKVTTPVTSSVESPSIKINLSQNKHHEFSDYRRSILASPALPFQPERTPKSSVLKATNSPIFVKKRLQRTLRSIPTTAAVTQKTASNAQIQPKNTKSKRKSPRLSKSLEKKCISMGIGVKQQGTFVTAQVSIKEKNVKNASTTPSKPFVKKLCNTSVTTKVEGMSGTQKFATKENCPENGKTLRNTNKLLNKRSVASDFF